MATRLTSGSLVFNDSSTESSSPFGSTASGSTITRSTGVTYTNSTGKPIQVHVYHNAYSGGTHLYVNGTEIIGTGSQTNTVYSLSFMVPTGGSYQLTTSYGIHCWGQIG